MVLVILALIWVAVLVPPIIRRRSERRPADSISAFRRQLTVLRRTRPYAPARGLVPERPRAHAYVAGPAAPVTSLSARRSMATARARQARPVAPRALAVAGLPSTRTRTLRRRRDVFVVLLGAAVLTLLLGLIPALRVVLYAHLVVDVLLGAYVALLVRQRGVAAEQDMKVRFFPGPQAQEPAMLRRTPNMAPALLRRSAN